MTDVARYRVEWTGSAVTGGGISTFHSLGAGPDLQSAVNTFFTAIKGKFPTSLTWHLPNGGEILDLATGKSTGAWTGGIATDIPANGPTGFAAGVGMRVVWDTAGFANGRRVRGSTYLVPLSNGFYSVDGTIGDGDVTSVTTAAQAMVTTLAGDLVVINRGPGPTTGTAFAVSSGRGVDKVSWLRSRRT